MNTKFHSMLGLFGGTFDPIHKGHLHVAHELLKALPFDEIRFIPCKQPVHRDQPQATATQRAEMIQCAVQNTEKLALDTRELDRDSESYTIDTVISFREEFLDTSLCLIMGMDAFLQLDQWRRWQKLLEYCHIVVVHRPGYELSQDSAMNDYLQQHQATDAEQLQKKSAGFIWLQPIELSDISASDIRAKLQAGESLVDELAEDAFQLAQKFYRHPVA